MKKVSYAYKNLPIPGGGYVTGFLYHKKEKNILYARTDIGGTYRFDFCKQNWVSLIGHVTMNDLSETFPIAIALDDNAPNVLYIACGEGEASGKNGVLAVSEDYGNSFYYEQMPVFVHGNLNGRGTADRLIVDANNSDILYFASQQEGLWLTSDRGKNWKKCINLQEQYLSFVAQVGQALIVATAGVTTGIKDFSGKLCERGHSLYVSYDIENGVNAHFEKLAEPLNRKIEGCRLNGLVAQRWTKDDKYFYVTFASTGRRSYVIENGYSCDSGDTIDGRIVRYNIENDGRIGAYTDITPISSSITEGINLPLKQCLQEPLDYGFSGISVSCQTEGMLVCTTIVKDDGDSVFRSYDYGNTWEQILYDLQEGQIDFRAPYMQPECNGGHSLIHWLSDIKINPFNENEAWFNSGTGVFRTQNLKTKDGCCFTDWCDGIEETVHLNVYALPSGDVQVIDILGDLGGFAFRELDKPCSNSFADENKNRYITCINADFSDINPNCFVVTPRGNWTGKTKGGLIYTKNQGKTFERLSMPFGISEDLDNALNMIECPNVNSGWVAMSPDTKHIVWSVADGIELPIRRLVVSHNGGKEFQKAQVFDKNGNEKTVGNIKVFSDRMDSSLFYGFGEHSDFYVSRDYGSTYYEKCIDEKFPYANFGLIDCADKTEIRGEAGKTGVFYIAIGKGGLWKLTYDTVADYVVMQCLSKEQDVIYRVGLGLGSPQGDYMRDAKAIYCNGIIDGEYGFYRSLDDGKTYERINNNKQMYGEINSIDGDCRVFGQFYLATGSNGVKYGMERNED